MDFLRFIVHYGMHFLLPILIAFIFFRKDFWNVVIIMLLANLIDVDHLFTNPIFDSNRCSIGFHFLHSYIAIGVYFALLFVPKTRIIAIGLVLHILTDFIDCLWIY